MPNVNRTTNSRLLFIVFFKQKCAASVSGCLLIGADGHLQEKNQSLNSTIVTLSSQVGKLQVHEEELSSMLRLKVFLFAVVFQTCTH